MEMLVLKWLLLQKFMKNQTAIILSLVTSVILQEGQNTSLTQAKVAGIFYVLIGGMVVAIIAAFAEFVYRSRLEARKTNVNAW